MGHLSTWTTLIGHLSENLSISNGNLGDFAVGGFRRVSGACLLIQILVAMFKLHTSEFRFTLYGESAKILLFQFYK